MRISVLCSDPMHPVNAWLERWKEVEGRAHEVRLVRRASELAGGDFLFLVSCHEIIRTSVRALFRYTLVLHASDLPEGRGMSPHVWQILEGRNEIVVSLLNAAEGVDTGDIWRKEYVHFEGHELHDEIHAALFDAELRLMTWALRNCDLATPSAQVSGGSIYRRRTPDDSKLDPAKSIAEQFELLRISDPHRYPAYIDFRGHRYQVKIEKVGPA